ncbi:C40 family peptidase [Nocardiopsis sp. N85]|uniref:C40 family peptidase n=1 Tax=Nocardiopsis sp. N85 TaxID=3029400 RepID=UPI00237EF15A|nr:C40 family peptidase [Nocardiopsis sp. N85]MDE3723153.1 C40 family peptidase [Nocardiopsis sp. N85]
MAGVRGIVGDLWRRARDLLLPEAGRDGDRGSVTVPEGGAAARVGGGVTALAVMGGIAYAATMCGPTGGVSASDVDGTGSTGGVVQASAVSPSSGGTIKISTYKGNPGETIEVVVAVPENILRIHRTAADAYGLPWELMAAIGAIETHNGQYVSSDPTWHSGLVEGQRNPYGAAGIVQFGVQDPNTGQVGGRLGSAGNAWGGKPKERVEDRRWHHEVGEMPANPRYFGIDGNNDGIVNVWDPWDNITSGAFRIAYYARQAESLGSGAVCGRSDLSAMECTVFKHNPAKWYVDQVMAVARHYQKSGIAPTSPSLNIVNASMTSSGSSQDCEEQGGTSQAAFLGNAGPAHRTAVEFARGKIGTPYVLGATGPSAYDCSSLVQAAWRAAGVQIPRTTWPQWLPNDPGHVYTGATTERMEVGSLLGGTTGEEALNRLKDTLQPGDLLFFHTIASQPSPSHVGMYSGGGMMIHAPGTGRHVEEVPLSPGRLSTFVGALRINPTSSGDPDRFDA